MFHDSHNVSWCGFHVDFTSHLHTNTPRWSLSPRVHKHTHTPFTAFTHMTLSLLWDVYIITTSLQAWYHTDDRFEFVMLSVHVSECLKLRDTERRMERCRGCNSHVTGLSCSVDERKNKLKHTHTVIDPVMGQIWLECNRGWHERSVLTQTSEHVLNKCIILISSRGKKWNSNTYKCYINQLFTQINHSTLLPQVK